MGLIEQSPERYADLAPFRVYPEVWDDSLAEVFGETPGRFPWQFQNFLFELSIGKLSAADFPRAEGISDHAYVVGVLKTAKAQADALSPALRAMLSDDGWEADDAGGASKKQNPG